MNIEKNIFMFFACISHYITTFCVWLENNLTSHENSRTVFRGTESDRN